MKGKFPFFFPSYSVGQGSAELSGDTVCPSLCHVFKVLLLMSKQKYMLESRYFSWLDSPARNTHTESAMTPPSSGDMSAATMKLRAQQNTSLCHVITGTKQGKKRKLSEMHAVCITRREQFLASLTQKHNGFLLNHFCFHSLTLPAFGAWHSFFYHIVNFISWTECWGKGFLAALISQLWHLQFSVIHYFLQ